jgi:hypothetical protein
VSTIENTEMSITELEKTDTTPIPVPPKIKIEYTNISGKQGYLFDRTELDTVSIQNGKICVKFTEPMWIYDLTLWIEKDSQPKSDKLARHTTVTVTTSRGDKREITMAAHDSYVDCKPKDFLTEIELKFTGINKISLSSPPACRKLTIEGLTSSEFYEFCGNVSSYIYASGVLNKNKESLIAKLKETNTEINKTQTSLSELQSLHEETKAELEKEQEKLKQAQVKTSQEEAKSSILNNQSSELEQRINESTRHLQNLSESVQDNREELEKLLADKNVFMEELSSYVEQGEKNIKAYTLIGLAFLAILSVCLWRLIESALRLSQDPQLLERISAFDLFLSRLPLAAVLGGVIILCLKLISSLLNRTFEIHQERLLLSKLSILAKDNSFSSVEGLNVEHGLIYEKRTALKMELLKEFLSGNYKGAAEKERHLRNRFEQFKSQLKKESDKKEKAKESTVDPVEDDE